jgi:hypothetical protein
MASVREKAKAFLDQIPPNMDVASKGSTEALFTKVTGWTQAQLQSTWKTEDIPKKVRRDAGQSTAGLATTTTCNAFTGRLGGAIGSPISLGQFDIELKLKRAGFGDAWIPAGSGERPGCGDVFRMKRFHVGASYEFDGDLWKTVEAGQGGPGDDYEKGFDVVKRKQQPWNPSLLQGWVNIEILMNLAKKAPKWMTGWWTFEVKGAKQYVWIPERGSALRLDNPPQSSKVAPTIGGIKGEVTYDDDANGLSIVWPDGIMPDKLRHLPGVDYMLGSRGPEQIQAYKVL